MDTLLNLFDGDWLPNIFAFLLGFSVLVYICLDGYDLGVGILSIRVNDGDKDKMIASIAPFWDANETWLVLAGGLMLVGFPMAQGIVFQQLYIPIAVMLIGLVLRGVSFDFRGKVPPVRKKRWDWSFFIGSLMTVLAQGYMLGIYTLGFAPGWKSVLFGLLAGCLAVAAVCVIGGGWLLMKTEGELQLRASRWTRVSLVYFALLMLVLGLAAPWLSEPIYTRWFGSGLYAFILFPVIIAAFTVIMYLFLRKNGNNPEKRCWIPYFMTVAIFILGFAALSMTFYPWIVMDNIHLVDAAASRDSLMIVLVGTVITMPLLIGYTIVAYRIFHGKVDKISYE